MSELYLIHSVNEATPDGDYLVHHGILGQKWGIRRYQNYDGTLTEAGKARIASYKEKADKYKQKVPNHYFTSIGEHKAKKYTRKAIAMEGKAAKIERASEKAQKKFKEKLLKKIYNDPQYLKYEKEQKEILDEAKKIESKIYSKNEDLRKIGEAPIDWSSKTIKNLSKEEKKLYNEYNNQIDKYYKLDDKKNILSDSIKSNNKFTPEQIDKLAETVTKRSKKI